MSENDFFNNNENFAKKIGKILKNNEEVSPYIEARLKAARLQALSMIKKEEKNAYEKFVDFFSIKVLATGALAFSFLAFSVGSILIKAETESVFKHNFSQIMVYLQDDVQQEKEMIEMIEILGEEV